MSLLYLYDYFCNEKYELENSRYYNPITGKKRELLNSDPEFNPNLKLTEILNEISELNEKNEWASKPNKTMASTKLKAKNFI